MGGTLEVLPGGFVVFLLDFGDGAGVLCGRVLRVLGERAVKVRDGVFLLLVVELQETAVVPGGCREVRMCGEEVVIGLLRRFFVARARQHDGEVVAGGGIGGAAA